MLSVQLSGMFSQYKRKENEEWGLAKRNYFIGHMSACFSTGEHDNFLIKAATVEGK